MEIKLSRLSIGFLSEIKVVSRNEFEITGDISMRVKYPNQRTVAPEFADIDRLRVIYNHDGLLEDIYGGQGEPDRQRLFFEVERYVNSSFGGERSFECSEDYCEDFEDVRLTDDNAIEVYADNITLPI